MYHRRCSIKAGMISAWRCSTSSVSRRPTAGSQGMMNWGASRGSATVCASGRALGAGGALPHDDARPGDVVTRVSRARATPKSTMAIGDGVAESTQPKCLEAVDGARW